MSVSKQDVMDALETTISDACENTDNILHDELSNIRSYFNSDLATLMDQADKEEDFEEDEDEESEEVEDND